MIDMQVSILYINTCCKLYIIECQCKISGTNHQVNKRYSMVKRASKQNQQKYIYIAMALTIGIRWQSGGFLNSLNAIDGFDVY